MIKEFFSFLRNLLREPIELNYSLTVFRDQLRFFYRPYSSRKLEVIFTDDSCALISIYC